MQNFHNGNPGPNDAELVHLLIEAIERYCPDPEVGEAMIKDVDFLNRLVDNINEVFDEEIKKAYLFDQQEKIK